MFEIPPFNAFPFDTFIQVIEKLEYLGEEVTPYEVSPGTALCLSDVYYSLSFLSFLHSYGCAVKKNDEWFLKPKGESLPKKPYRYKLIAEATEILQVLSVVGKLEKEVVETVPKIDPSIVPIYLRILTLLGQKGKVEQTKSGWDASFTLTNWL